MNTAELNTIFDRESVAQEIKTILSNFDADYKEAAKNDAMMMARILFFII